MKKLLCGVLALTLILGGLSGCQSSGVSQEAYDKVVSERDELKRRLDELESSGADTAPMESQEEATPSQTQEQEPLVLVDQDGIKISFLGIGEDYLGSTLKLKIENNSEHNITVQQRDMSINGIMIDGILSSDVSAGKIANDAVSILASDLEENGIEQIDNVELSFVVINADSWDHLIESGATHITINYVQP